MVYVEGKNKSCKATGFVGDILLFFNRHLSTEPSYGLGGLSIAFITITILCLIGGVGVLVWKMQSQRNIIDHLAGIVFRDVGPAGSSNSTTASPDVTGGLSNNANFHNAVGGSMRGNSDLNPFPSSVS